MELGPIHTPTSSPVRDDYGSVERPTATEADPLLSSSTSNPASPVRRDLPLTSLSIALPTADSTLDGDNYDMECAECADTFFENPKASTSSIPALSKGVLLRGRLTLLFVAFLFGSFNVVLRLLYEMPGPPSASVLSCTRGWLAVSCFAPALLKMARGKSSGSNSMEQQQRCGGRKPIWVAASELALWNFGALALLNVGLLFVESARASFLTQTSVVITPLVSSVSGQRVGRTVWAGCAAALVGLVLLSDTGKPTAVTLDDDDDYIDVGDDDATDNAWLAFRTAMSSLSFSAGDLLVLGGALSWSMYIFRLSSIGNRYSEIHLQAMKTLSIATMYTTWVIISATRCYVTGGWDAVAELWLGWRSWQAWALLAFSAVGTGALADVLQQYGQKMVSASEANILLCIEPVFTMMLGRVLLGEMTSATEKAGGVLIVFAALLASQ